MVTFLSAKMALWPSQLWMWCLMFGTLAPSSSSDLTEWPNETTLCRISQNFSITHPAGAGVLRTYPADGHPASSRSCWLVVSWSCLTCCHWWSASKWPLLLVGCQLKKLLDMLPLMVSQQMAALVGWLSDDAAGLLLKRCLCTHQLGSLWSRA